MLAFKLKSNKQVISFTKYDQKKLEAPRIRSDSQDTLVDAGFNLLDFPTEILTMIAMHSGFVSATKLAQTCVKYKTILDRKSSWKDYSTKSTDVLEMLVTMDTALHQFDQISFCTWPINGTYYPCMMHLSFSDQYDFLGGVSFTATSRTLKTEFFESRERLECPLDDAEHICETCTRYADQKIERTCFVHSPDNPDISHFYCVNQHLNLTVVVRSAESIRGYSSSEPSLTIQLYKLNDRIMSPRAKTLYNYYCK